MQQENSILSRNFLLGVNAAGLHLVYSGDRRTARARQRNSEESDERSTQEASTSPAPSVDEALGDNALAIGLSTPVVSYPFAQIVRLAPEADALALTVHAEEIEQFHLRTPQVKPSAA